MTSQNRSHMRPDVIRLLHTQRRATFAGRFYRLDDALCEPKPYGGRRLPVLIGGAGSV